jgi:transcriptional regulator with XRE-family HTH domain
MFQATIDVKQKCHVDVGAGIAAPYRNHFPDRLLHMTRKSGPVPRFIDELNEEGGLSGTDLANIADVSKATVSRWKSGTVKPQPSTQLVLSDLHYVVGRLKEYYTADEIRTWLYARHPQLGGARAIDLINQNRSEDVLRVLDRLDADVFL